MESSFTFQLFETQKNFCAAFEWCEQTILCFANEEIVETVQSRSTGATRKNSSMKLQAEMLNLYN
jgi:hypothetical protein